jgi:hypothetical protein
MMDGCNRNRPSLKPMTHWKMRWLGRVLNHREVKRGKQPGDQEGILGYSWNSWWLGYGPEHNFWEPENCISLDVLKTSKIIGLMLLSLSQNSVGEKPRNKRSLGRSSGTKAESFGTLCS